MICFGPDAEADANWVQSFGCQAQVFDGTEDALSKLETIDLVIGSGPNLSTLRQKLAQRDGAIVQVRSRKTAAPLLYSETAICIDTTAAGGNVDLLSG